MAILYSVGGQPPASFRGFFLLAAEDLLDSNFYRTAVLIVQHDETGALGLVLNRPTQAPLGLILPQLTGAAASSLPLFWGGPVQPEYLFILQDVGAAPVRLSSEAGNLPLPGVAFQAFTGDQLEFLKKDYEKLKLAERPALRVMAGYAGWGPGQLEVELERRSWYWHPADRDLVFAGPPNKIWETVLSLKGPLFQTLADSGTLPSVN